MTSRSLAAGVNFDLSAGQHCSELQPSGKEHCFPLGKAHREPDLFIFLIKYFNFWYCNRVFICSVDPVNNQDTKLKSFSTEWKVGNWFSSKLSWKRKGGLLRYLLPHQKPRQSWSWAQDCWPQLGDSGERHDYEMRSVCLIPTHITAVMHLHVSRA